MPNPGHFFNTTLCAKCKNVRLSQKNGVFKTTTVADMSFLCLLMSSFSKMKAAVKKLSLVFAKKSSPGLTTPCTPPVRQNIRLK